jgi:O-6-methylguanine DNA methyltransferase
MPNDLRLRILASPLGPLTIGSVSRAEGAAACVVEFGHRAPGAIAALARLMDAHAPEPGAAEPCPVLDALEHELAAYFAGTLRAFSVPIVAPGTPFQQRVWAELARIPYGTTISYGELARRVGSPGAARAVGAANGANRLAIVLPCHRVIDAAGQLHGYGGGLDNKRRLLELEGALRPAPLFA